MDLLQIWGRHGGRCVLRIEMSRFEVVEERKESPAGLRTCSRSPNAGGGWYLEQANSMNLLGVNFIVKNEGLLGLLIRIEYQLLLFFEVPPCKYYAIPCDSLSPSIFGQSVTSHPTSGKKSFVRSTRTGSSTFNPTYSPSTMPTELEEVCLIVLRICTAGFTN